MIFEIFTLLFIQFDNIIAVVIKLLIM